MAKVPKRPRDSAQLAKLIVEIAAGERENDKPAPPSETEERASKGGKARAKGLSKAKRRRIAKAAARSRWKKG